ncbi:hypothetical protein M3F63_07125 [Brachybacterium muris]|uniref:hypothetical protein n=1 Tax=Brachybacterium muris TaxID=219301 RepID=UPI00223B39CD|nr:hypothetical protein [Brachybacterium muris]MCT2177440.1 hypothetical protein [Brachybacterium muris]
MNNYDEQYIRGLKGSKRASIVWAPWMGDWFVSHSPRNGNDCAEGTWDHWVQVAVSILQHPATAIVRPEAHEAVAGVANTDFYSESGRGLSDEEVEALFGEGDDQ